MGSRRAGCNRVYPFYIRATETGCSYAYWVKTSEHRAQKANAFGLAWAEEIKRATDTPARLHPCPRIPAKVWASIPGLAIGESSKLIIQPSTPSHECRNIQIILIESALSRRQSVVTRDTRRIGPGSLRQRTGFRHYLDGT
jgi:hypothetical protein